MSAIIISMAFLLLICCSTICLSISIAVYMMMNNKTEKTTETTKIIKTPEELMNPRSKQVYEFYRDDWVRTDGISKGIKIKYEVTNDKLNMLIIGDGSETIPIKTAQILPKDKDLYELLAAKTVGIDGQIIVDKGNNNLIIFKIIDKNRMEITSFKNGFPIPTTYIRTSERARILKMEQEQKVEMELNERQEQKVEMELSEEQL